MSILCRNCGLNTQIENCRKTLNNLINGEQKNLLDKEVIKASQALDDLLFNCVFCENNLNFYSAVSLKDIFGTHSTFYYYGHEHLFTNMFFYIKEGIKNNELIYISMEHDLYEKLIQVLKEQGIDVEYIYFRPVKELIMSNKEGGLHGLENKIDDICLEDKARKYSGVRWIGQPTYAIQTTSQDDFLNWEINLSESLRNKKVSLICIYDAYDYMHEGKFINKEVITKSISTHSYLLKNLILEKIG